MTKVTRTDAGSFGCVHKVALECLSDDTLGREIVIIWEREIAPTTIESASLPRLETSDDPALFSAFLSALRWSSASLAEGDVLQAPFRGGVQIEEYQLAPVIRASQMPRISLLIADDVGLGKTIEAGLIAQELIHSHRATRILIVCPAHLKQKWVDEMAEKFGLEFRIIERDTVVQMRREFGPTINPWASFPRLVTSVDYLKTEHPRRLFEELVDRRQEESKGGKPWDLLILDEAHNVAPSGRKQYVRDSDRTTLMRGISEYFEHKVFLTATPHNGYRESFTGLLELLDSLRFSRGTDLDMAQLSAVTVRRLKDEILNPDGTRRFPKRLVLPRSPEQDPQLYVDLAADEQEIFSLLQQYTKSRLEHVDPRTARPTQFVLTLLKKRALSSPLALRETLVTHSGTVGVREELDIGDSLFRTLEQREDEDWSDDDEKEETLEAVTSAASHLLQALSPDEKAWLQRMFEIADSLRKRPDSKARALLQWIRDNLQTDGSWNGERVIIFTEYRHTLEYLKQVLEDEGLGGAVLSIVGGMGAKEREEINEAFQAAPDVHPVRILLATDAASEGADFQRYCRNLIHYEIPWNPVRLEQRNGRVDRHGQKASEVRIHHFVFRNQEDSEFLKGIVEKVQAIRTDLGSVSALIADSVQQHALGRQVSLQNVEWETRRALARKELALDPQASDDIRSMVEALNKARETLGVTNEAQATVLSRALALEGKPDCLHFNTDGTFTLASVPSAWSECRRYLTTDYHTRLLTFDRELTRDRDDVVVVHLDHPLMRRAIATFRSQMWNSLDHKREGLHRTCIEVVSGLSHPVAIGWGRLVLLGPEHNRLHEGLIRVGAYLTSSHLIEMATQEADWALSLPRQALNSLKAWRPILSQLPIERLSAMLKESGSMRAQELNDFLSARGDLAAKQARNLVTSRMDAIRKTIRKWETEAESIQQRLWETDEKKQKEQDMYALRVRLDELHAEREQESKRQRGLYKVAEQRVYPVAVQVLLPAEAP